MSLPTPTTADVQATIVSQLEAAFNQTIPLLPKAFNRVLAKVLAGVFVLLWKYASWIFLQLFVAHASYQSTEIGGRVVRPLVEWGRLIGVGDPNPATAAELTVTVTVTEQTGTLLAGQLLMRETTGVIYSVVAAVALNAASVTITVQAVDDDTGGEGLGTIGNLQPGDALSFASPPRNVSTTAVVATVVRTAADEETEVAYRSRVLRRFQRKPQGGAYADYQAWGEEPEGIANVYPYTGDPGEVDVYVEAVATEGNPDGIPTSDQLAAVLAAINLDDEGLATRRPANAAVNTIAITRKALNVTITGLVVEDEDTVEGDLEEAIDEYLRSLEPFIVGLSTLPRTDRALAADIGAIISDTVRAAGGTFGDFVLLDGVDEISAYTLGTGEKCKLGTLTT